MMPFLGKWDERGERLFVWPLASFPDRHTYSIHSILYCLSCFDQFCWDLIRTCGSATCYLMDGMNNLWTKWWRLLFPILLFNSFTFFIMVQVFTIPYTCLRFVQLQSNFRQSLTGYIADVAETFEILIWISRRAAWNFLLNSLLSIPCTCLPPAAVYPLWAFCISACKGCKASCRSAPNICGPKPQGIRWVAYKLIKMTFFFCKLIPYCIQWCLPGLWNSQQQRLYLQRIQC